MKHNMYLLIDLREFCIHNVSLLEEWVE